MHLIYCVPFNVMITLVSNGHIMRSNQLGGCSLSFRKLSVLRLLGTYSLHIASLFFSNWNAKFSIKPVGRSHHWRIPPQMRKQTSKTWEGSILNYSVSLFAHHPLRLTDSPFGCPSMAGWSKFSNSCWTLGLGPVENAKAFLCAGRAFPPLGSWTVGGKLSLPSSLGVQWRAEYWP